MSAKSHTTDDLKIAIKHTLDMISNGRPDLAEEQAGEILKVYPGEVNALRTLGAARRLQGRPQEALAPLLEATEKAAKFAQAWQELGLTQRACEEPSQAVQSFQKALQLDSTLASSWRSLGECYLDCGQDEEAQQAFQRHLATTSRDPELLKAIEFLNQKKLALAEQVARSYLKRNPQDVSAIRLLADIAIRLKVFVDAEKLLERALELAPDYHLARMNYVSALNGRQKSEEALAQLAILEKTEAGKPAHMILKASVLTQMGEFRQAIALYQSLLKDQPPQANIAMSLGHALKTVGETEAAIAAYEQAIQLQTSLGEAYWSLANLKTFRFSDHQITAMRKCIKDDKVARNDYFHLCFALGKALEDRQDFDTSFHYYALGNQVKKKLEAYRSDINHSETQAMIKACRPALFQGFEHQGCQKRDPIFIVGLPRSGSTLLEQILASHSQVDGTKELPDIIAIARRLGAKEKRSDSSRYPAILETLERQQRLALGEEFLKRTQIQRGEAPLFIDKMPNNFAHIGLIKLILPKAKIIDARRHPMAACFGGFKQLFASGQRFTYSLEDIGNYYRDYIELMNHYHKVLPGQIHTVLYEDVVADTEQSVRKLLDFCELPFEEACLNFHQTERAVRTASAEQVRQPIYSSALELWKHYETHLDTLRQALGSSLQTYKINN